MRKLHLNKYTAQYNFLLFSQSDFRTQIFVKVRNIVAILREKRNKNAKKCHQISGPLHWWPQGCIKLHIPPPSPEGNNIKLAEKKSREKGEGEREKDKREEGQLGLSWWGRKPSEEEKKENVQ